MELTFVNMITVDKRKDNHLLSSIIIIKVAVTLFINTVDIVDMNYKSIRGPVLIFSVHFE